MTSRSSGNEPIDLSKPRKREEPPENWEDVIHPGGWDFDLPKSTYGENDE